MHRVVGWPIGIAIPARMTGCARDTCTKRSAARDDRIRALLNTAADGYRRSAEDSESDDNMPIASDASVCKGASCADYWLLCAGSRKCIVLPRRHSLLTAGKRSRTMTPKLGMTLTQTANGTSGNAARATAQQASLRARGGCSLLLGYACFCSKLPLTHAALLLTVRKATYHPISCRRARA
jgi:hypothetical protein